MPSRDGGALAGVKILDLCRIVSGPFATMQLGDLGADVVKVEEPALGDESRRYGPPFVGGESAYFLSVNRNKRSVAIDLKSPAGREVVLALAKVADVVIENFRPGTMARLGLDDDALRAGNDRLILCSISGFGRSGPERDRPAYDLILQGESGVMDITGEPGGAPMKVGTSIADMTTSLYATQAILAALFRRERTGKGGRVDVAMLDAMASLLTFNAGVYFTTGQSPRRRGNLHPTITPYETFATRDGFINVAVANDKFWASLCKALELGDQVANDARFATAPARVAHRTALAELLQPRFAARPRDEWLARLSAASVPCGAIKTVGEVCETPSLVERGMVQTAKHPTAGDVRFVASPILFDEEPPPPSTAPPRLGEHTDEVLREWLGWSGGALASARAQGAFGP